MVVIRDSENGAASVPTDERGSALDARYYSTQGELFDRLDVWPEDIQYMLEHDSQANELEGAITLPLRGTKIDIEPAEGDKGEAKFVREVLLRPPWAGGMQTPIQEVFSQMTAAVSIKRAYFEKVWRLRDDGKAVYDKVAWRDPMTCTLLVDHNRAFRGFRQRSTRGNGEPFIEDFLQEQRKCFVYIHRAHRKPLLGESAFQTAFQDYVEKLKVNRLWDVHLQTFALGRFIGRYIGTLKDGARRLFNKLMGRPDGGTINTAGGGVMVLGADENVEIKNQVGAGQEFKTKIDYHNLQMAASVQHRLSQLGTNSDTGSYALAKSHLDIHVMNEQSIQDDMLESVSMWLIGDLVEANFGKDAAFPRAVAKPIAEDTLDLAVQTYTQLLVPTLRATGGSGGGSGGSGGGSGGAPGAMPGVPLPPGEGLAGARGAAVPAPLLDGIEDLMAQRFGVPQEKMEAWREEQKKKTPAPGAPPSPAVDPSHGQGLVAAMQHLLTQAPAGGAPAPTSQPQGTGASPVQAPAQAQMAEEGDSPLDLGVDEEEEGDPDKFVYRPDDVREVDGKASLKQTELAEVFDPVKHPRDSHGRFVRIFGGNKEAHAWAKEHWGDAAKNLSPEAKDSVKRYSSGAYRRLNQYLRGQINPKTTKGEMDKQIKGMDEAVSNHPLGEPVSVLRALDGNSFGGVPLDSLEGKTFKDDGFMSTALKNKPPRDLASKQAVLHLTVPSGTPAIYVPSLQTDRRMAAEQELLLGRGQSFRVNSSTYNPRSGKWNIEAEVLPQGTGEAPAGQAGQSPPPAQAQMALEDDAVPLGMGFDEDGWSLALSDEERDALVELAAWNPELHPRWPKGTPHAGKFMPKVDVFKDEGHTLHLKGPGDAPSPQLLSGIKHQYPRVKKVVYNGKEFPLDNVSVPKRGTDGKVDPLGVGHEAPEAKDPLEGVDHASNGHLVVAQGKNDAPTPEQVDALKKHYPDARVLNWNGDYSKLDGKQKAGSSKTSPEPKPEAAPKPEAGSRPEPQPTAAPKPAPPSGASPKPAPSPRASDKPTPSTERPQANPYADRPSVGKPSPSHAEHAKRALPVLDKATGAKSGWSGKVNYVGAGEGSGASGANATKAWNCDISLNAARANHPGELKTLTHELLHSYSNGLTPEAYRDNRGWEEGPVERSAQLHGPKAIKAMKPDMSEGQLNAALSNKSYGKYTGVTENMRKALGEKPQEFYKNLLNVPLPERSEYVKGLAQEKLSGAGLASFNRQFPAWDATLKGAA